MRNIMCYGDSNTWGYNPEKGGLRHEYDDRWTTKLGKNLGDEYLVIPEGLNGRTTVWNDSTKLYNANGRDRLLECLESHKPLDLVVIMLGTNDLKKRHNLPSVDIANGVGVLIDIIKNSKCGIDNLAPEVLVLIPPEVRELSNFKEVFGECVETSQDLPRVFKIMAEGRGIPYLEIGKKVRFSDIDGIHFTKDQLTVLADIVSDKVRSII